MGSPVCLAQRTSNIRSGCIGPSSGQMATQSSPSGSDGVSAEPTTKKKKRKKIIKKTASGMWHTRGGGLLCLLLSASPTGAPRSARTSKGLRATLRSAYGALEVAEAHLKGQQQPLRPAPPRGLPTDGLKKELKERLLAAITTSMDEGDEDSVPEVPGTTI